jgi:hypothetical protein
MMRRLIVGSLVVALVLGGLQLSPQPSQAQTPDTASYFQFIDAMNQGSVTRALTSFTDDAVIEGFPPFCLDTCRGRAAIQRQLDFEVGAKINLQLLSSLQQVGPNRFTAVVSHRADIIRMAGLSRVIIHDTVTFNSQGKITRLEGEPDFSDSQTATFAFLLTQPMPGPGAPASSAPASGPAGSTGASGAAASTTAIAITPPSTGSAGLASLESDDE